MRRLAHHVWRKTRQVKLHPAEPGLEFFEQQRIPRVLAVGLPICGGIVLVGWGTPSLREELQGPSLIFSGLLSIAMLALLLTFQVEIELRYEVLTFAMHPFLKRQIHLDDVVEVRFFSWGAFGHYARWAGHRAENTHGVQMVMRSGETVLIVAAHAAMLVKLIREAKGIGLLTR